MLDEKTLKKMDFHEIALAGSGFQSETMAFQIRVMKVHGGYIYFRDVIAFGKEESHVATSSVFVPQ